MSRKVVRSDAERDLRKRLDKLYKRWVNGKASRQDKLELLANNRITEVQSGVSHAHRNGHSEQAENMTELSNRLNALFQGKIVSTVSRTQIRDWLKGSVPNGSPLPPKPVNEKYDIIAWAEWFAVNILPQPNWGFQRQPLNGNESSLMQRQVEAKANREIDEAAITALNRRIKERDYKSVEVFNLHIKSFFTECSAYIGEGEQLMERTLLEAIGASGLDESKRLALQQSVRKAVQMACDNFTNGLRQSLAKHTESSKL